MYCRTTEGAAGPAVGLATKDVPDPHRPVYLVVLVGHFVDTKSFSPTNSYTPTATTITFTADPRTHGVLDFGLTNRRVPAPKGCHWSGFAVPTTLTGQASSS